MSVVMHLNGVELFSGLSLHLKHALHNSNTSILGSGSKRLLVVLQHFLAEGMIDFFLVDRCYACLKTFMKHIIGKSFN